MKSKRIQRLMEVATPEVKAANLKIWKLIEQAKFPEAFRIADKLMAENPGDFLVSRIYSMLLADSAETLSFSKRKKQKEAACKIMRKLLRKPPGQPPRGIPLRDYYSLRNELYFHSGQWAKQAKLGEDYRGRLPSAAYSVCVGHAWRAARYHCNGRDALARKFAHKSLDASPAAIKEYPKFYNLYLHLSLAAGIAEGMQSARRYLAKAKRFSGRDDSHHEFKEIIEVLTKRRLRDAY
jgi:hypothetical protein